MHFWVCYLNYTCLNAGFLTLQKKWNDRCCFYSCVCTHTAVLLVQLLHHHPDSRSTRVQQAVVLLMYTKKYGRTYAVCISYHGRVYRCTPGYVRHAHA